MRTPRRFSRLLDELCLECGHCGSEIYVTDLLPVDGLLTARKFAELVLEAEKMTEQAYGKQYLTDRELIEKKFEEHLGCSEINSKLLVGMKAR